MDCKAYLGQSQEGGLSAPFFVGAVLGRMVMEWNTVRTSVVVLSLPGQSLRIASQVGMRLSLLGTQARRAEDSPLQEAHVAEVS